VTRPKFSRVVWVPRNYLIETSSSRCLVICRRAFGVAAMVLAAYENEIQANCFFVSVSSSRIVATLHITFSWLPLQVCSQVRCRPYLAAHFGFFDLRTFPRSLCQVQVSTFYPLTPRVGSKCTYIILTSSSVKPSIVFLQLCESYDQLCEFQTK